MVIDHFFRTRSFPQARLDRINADGDVPIHRAVRRPQGPQRTTRSSVRRDSNGKRRAIVRRETAMQPCVGV